MPEMKNSYIEWIGEVPTDWVVEKGKFHFTNNKYIPGIKSSEYDRLALTLKGVISRSKDDADGLQPKDFNTYQLLRENELVFKLIDLQNVSTSRVGLAHATGLVSPAYIVLHSDDKILPEYAEKFYLMMWHREIFNALGDNGVRSNLGVSDLLNVPITIPPLNVQKSIANFLDKKCSEIDSLSTDIQEEIDTLEEYRKSIITEAVTRGLNPDAEMRDSGIEWIGMIPVHWDVDKIKYHLKRNEPRNPGNVPVLSVYREYGVIPKDSRDDNHNVTSEDTSKYKYVKPGDLVINKMKAWQGSLAVSEYEGIVSPAYFVYNFTDELFNKKYFHFLIRSCYKEEFRRISGGIREGQWDLPAEGFANELVLLPPIAEQKEIAIHLDAKCAEIESLIADKKKQLELLEEYKKSLIYEYVTGKKEVPSSETNTTVAVNPQVILLGAIIDRIGNSQHGRVQLQKLLYLCDIHFELNPNVQYYRYNHGPYDVHLNDHINELLQKHWYYEKREKGSFLLVSGRKHKEFLQNHVNPFGEKQREISKLFHNLKDMRTSQLERIATLYAAWNDFLIDGITPSDDQIIQNVVSSWTDNKANSQYSTWQDSLNKMRRYGLIPRGQGLHTLPKPQKEVSSNE